MATNTTMSLPIPRHRERVRYFATIWAGITLLFGAGTFIAVYAGTGVVNAKQLNLNGGLGSNGSGVAALQITATPFPTFPPENTEVPATVPTDAPTEAPAQPAAVGPTATIPPKQDTAFDLGIAVQKNADPNVYKIWVSAVKDDLKLNWVKSQIVWRDTEKVKGQIDFAEMDVAINQLSEANVKVMLSITKAPDWARDPGAKIAANQFDGPPANPQDLADFVTAILTRYPGKVHAIEVWNEINLDREWSTNPQRLDARRYVDLLRVTRDAIRAIDPNIIVISSALAPTGGNGNPNSAQDDFVYMDSLIAAGVLQYADCVGTHHNGLNVPPTAADYRNIPERVPPAKYRGPWSSPHHSWSFRATLQGYMDKIRAANSTTPLCVTEFGWPSMEGLTGQPREGFGYAFDNTLQDQATFTDEAITWMQQSGAVRLAFVWNLNYGAQVGWKVAPDDPVSDNVLWAILGPEWSKRPVWQKIADRNFRGQPRTAAP
ncbi:MAG: cellulase family glycosylhydrolase [Anaerolineae bacterium]|nr:cellulase family glycosylhydrolase [Anaerolineae bacterium]